MIHIDPVAIHPVLGGYWHRTQLPGIPEPGQTLVMLCGARGVAAFEALARRCDRGAPHRCTECDARYRRAIGMPPSPFVRPHR
ncbi:hypothetical protein [Amycolatopsis sp. NBC_01286]|uniref:hypothetical protein n=1 Tax=Amycolatopsis sp. NBC_01286 TaxID=2903560 RepID=UPI002E10D906|nr:hypothetical protein OG570_19990 [Amycolatopsis sp. NBC_01286]